MSDMNWGEAIRQKAQGTTDAPFWNAAADEIERNRAAIAELVDVMNQLCIRIWNEGASPLDWNEYDAALAAIIKHDTTTKEGN